MDATRPFSGEEAATASIAVCFAGEQTRLGLCKPEYRKAVEAHPSDPVVLVRLSQDTSVAWRSRKRSPQAIVKSSERLATDFQIRIVCQPSEQSVLSVNLKNTQNLNFPKLGVSLARFRRARSPFRSLFGRRVREQTPGIEIKIAAVVSDELDELKTELFILLVSYGSDFEVFVVQIGVFSENIVETLQGRCFPHLVWRFFVNVRSLCECGNR